MISNPSVGDQQMEVATLNNLTEKDTIMDTSDRQLIDIKKF